MYLDSDRRPPITPQFALRVAIMGGLALVLFGIVFFRLWYLQILSGDRYLAEANTNRVREVTVQAPRGKILDRNGTMLVDNRNSEVVQITPDKLPPPGHARQKLYVRLGKVLGLSPKEISRDVNDQFKKLPYSAATVKEDVNRDQMAYILENQRKFPAVTVQSLFLRQYPHHQIGAHLFGTVGEVNQDQLKEHRYRGVKQGDRVGQSGIEYSYDRFLRGRDGANRFQVDALGELRGQLAVRRAVPGRNLRLSVDLDLQRAGQDALGSAHAAFVVMDAHNGEIRALGSSPSFDPNIFAKKIKASDFKRLSDPNLGAPLADRAMQGLYPTGSTFKLITSVAALQGGLITPDTVQYDGGSLQVGTANFRNAGGAVNGAIALRQALKVSSDVFFYRLGLEANGSGDGHLIQKWAARLGVGRPTGIDLPGEVKGLVPSPEWRNRLFKKHLTDRPWSAGDNINLSVGQGDLQTNPLQMAVAYAAVANGGYIVRPHLGERVEDAGGQVLQEIHSPPRRRVHIDPAYRQAILDGMHLAAQSPGGTSYKVMGNFPIPVAGKTGTAQKGAGRADQSWYIVMAPYPRPKYIVAVTFEAGGFGVETAAPAARQILSQLYDIKGKAATSEPGSSGGATGDTGTGGLGNTGGGGAGGPGY